MISWKDRSQPVVRRPVRGHSIVFDGIFADFTRDGFPQRYVLKAYCTRCRSFWSVELSLEQRRRAMDGPNRRRAVGDLVALAASRTPTCEEAHRAMVARDVMES